MSRLMLGTWNTFLNKTDCQIEEFIENCIKLNCLDFDTAYVYSDGDAERMLGKYSSLTISTKIPAKIKPSLNEFIDINTCYSSEWMKKCLDLSTCRIKRIPDTLFLHNWSAFWHGTEMGFKEFIDFRNEGLAKSIGISLPNGFNGKLSHDVLNSIDWIMAPFNKEEKWIESNSEALKCYGIKIICRSLFMGGNLLIDERKELKNYFKDVRFADKVLVGTSNIEHVKQIQDILSYESD